VSDSKTISFVVELLRQLPLEPKARLQGGIIRIPTWVKPDDPPDAPPFRPWVTIWINLRDHKANAPALDRFGRPDPADALLSLARFCNDRDVCGFRPGTVEVGDLALRDYLASQLEGTEIRVVHRTHLAELAGFLSHLADHLNDGAPDIPGPLAGKGVTVEAVRAFADAAAGFYRAAPWRFLCDEDLLRVEAPVMDKRMRWCVVMGNAEKTFGVGFFDTPDSFRIMCEAEDPERLFKLGLWMLTYGPRHELPFPDEDLWHDHDLPAASDDAFPIMIRVTADGQIQRPDLKQLTALEGLLRVLSRTTEAQFEAGRWSVDVPTHGGPRTFTIAQAQPAPARSPAPGSSPLANILMREKLQRDLDRLLAEQNFPDQASAQRFIEQHLSKKTLPALAPETPFDRAQDLCAKAMDLPPRQGDALARQALEIYPDCADAYLLLSGSAGSREQALAVVRKAVDAGARQLGPDYFRRNAGHFWGLVDTRPFMRALMRRAMLLMNLGRTRESLADYLELLRLDHADLTGTRFLLIPLLLQLGELDQAEALLKRFKDDDLAFWHWARALLIFRQKGPGTGATRQANKALSMNPHVPRFLLDSRPIPPGDPSSTGDPGEAAYIARLLKSAFDAMPGAPDWLDGVLDRRK